jgi:hypothetical protein
MVIALAQTLREEGINYQHTLHVTAIDLDIVAVHMACVLPPGAYCQLPIRITLQRHLHEHAL